MFSKQKCYLYIIAGGVAVLSRNQESRLCCVVVSITSSGVRASDSFIFFANRPFFLWGKVLFFFFRLLRNIVYISAAAINGIIRSSGLLCSLRANKLCFSLAQWATAARKTERARFEWCQMTPKDIDALITFLSDALPSLYLVCR